LPNWILNFPYGDWPTYLWVLKNGGKIHFLKDVTAVYRMEIGISAKIRKSLSSIDKINLGILDCLVSDEKLFHKKKIIKESIHKTRTSLMISYNRENKYFKGLKLFFKIISAEKNKMAFLKLYIYSVFKSVKRIDC
jgi:hypothetical protein